MADAPLVLDGTKIAWHAERVQAWEAGERIAPVSIDTALTRACDASCWFCYAILQESQSRENISVDIAKGFIDDCAAIGVKAISLVSDGESDLSPAYVPFIEYAKSVGIDVGSGTNGWRWINDVPERVLPHLTWVRFNVSGGTPRRYAEIMYGDQGHTRCFWNAMNNISRAVEIKRRRSLSVTIGTQMVLGPKDADQIIPFAKLSLDLGTDYGVIKHCSDDEYGSLGIDYGKYKALYEGLAEAEAMSNATTKIIIKWQKIKDEGRPSYKRFYAPPFLLQTSGSGLVAPSGMFFNARYSKMHIGNITEERFIDIWRSDRYWDCMNYLASPYFDASTMMGTLPIQHYTAIALDNHVKGIMKLERPDLPEPAHVNFL